MTFWYTFIPYPFTIKVSVSARQIPVSPIMPPKRIANGILRLVNVMLSRLQRRVCNQLRRSIRVITQIPQNLYTTHYTLFYTIRIRRYNKLQQVI